MKYIKKATKFTILIVLLFIIFNIAAYSYAYLSPKLQIKSANKFMLFDQDNELFFQEIKAKVQVLLHSNMLKIYS